MRQQFIKQYAQRIDIRSFINVPRDSFRLLGRHVFQRAHDLARYREQAHPGLRQAHRSGKSEVQDLGFPLRIDQDIRGLQIAMHHALPVRVCNNVADLGKHRQPFTGCKRLTLLNLCSQ